MGMSMPYELTGRTDQKTRTRNALIDATRELLAEGLTPTVEQAAAAAAISRTTAYRYFPNQRSLLVAAHPETEATSLLSADAPEDGEARFALAVAALTDLVVNTEPQLRAMLRLSLEPPAGEGEHMLLRQGRAIGWLEEALAPLRARLSQTALRRLVLATRSSCGIESLVWLTDVAGLSREEAVEVMRWSADALLQATLRASAAPRADAR
jgi:AcrR family transcriptional regulator